MIYIFVAVMAVLFGFAAGSDFVRVGQSIGNTHTNAPFVVALWYAGASLLTCFMATAIYDSSASRDFSTKMSDILFSKPLSKWGYLMGRFSAATIIAILPALGISMGIIAAQLVNFSDLERWGPIRVWDHLLPILVFTIPNTLLFGAVVFAIAITTRNTLYSFLGVLFVLVGYGVAQGVAGSLDYELFTCLSDPFGADAYDVSTKYWTVDDRNTRSIPFTPLLLGNRVLWLSVSALVFGIAASRFTFEARAERSRKKKNVGPVIDEPTAMLVLQQVASIPKRTPQISWFAQFGSAFRSDLSCVLGNITFVVVLCLTALYTGLALFLAGDALYGTPSFPVTYKMVDIITLLMVHGQFFRL